MAVDPEKLNKVGDQMMAAGCAMTVVVFGTILLVVMLIALAGTCFKP